MAGRAPVQRLRDDGEARGDAGDLERVASLFDDGLSAARLWWRLENTVRSVGDVLLRAEDAHKRFDFVVVRRKLFIGDGPVVAHAVGGASLEVGRAEAECDASPMVGAAAFNARAEPAERRARSNCVRFAFNLPKAIGREELAEISARPASNACAAVRQFVGPDVLFEVLVGIECRTRLEHHYAQASLGQHLGGGSASRARSDDADVI